MLALACLIAVAAAAPASYDQRQDGDFNIRADVQNVVLVVAVPQKMTIPPSLLESILMNSKQNTKVEDRSDVRIMEAFVEPNTPYHVEIGSDRSAGGDGRAVEVVIAGRRRLGNGPQIDAQTDLQSELQSDPEPEGRDELKLLGATEQCGPDWERDPVTLECRPRSSETSQALSTPSQDKEEQTTHITENRQPEVVPVSTLPN